MNALPAEITIHRADSFDEVPPTTFYRIAKLRQEVFVLEQDCVYLDLDGRDLEQETIQVWAETTDGSIASSVRILNEDAQEPGLRSIGRVVTSPAHRGQGIAAAVLNTAIEVCGDHPIQIHAQSYLTEWYARFGFTTNGEEFLEDGIPHTPMRIG
ncbi:GNAT family N-acetyltransferase [Leucobacter coleopterorum]|uniref:GNAT family N-acetyltransferase n=2 Tax=Leucobacter coleopterorum TaxID=2714933 RepID=A0ABX6JYT2_9MICO|nr:GNAT family N-acetyltransferase [Leucobacter coleopterorum]